MSSGTGENIPMNDVNHMAENDLSQHAFEIAEGNRFEFGKNWKHFLRVVDDERINEAVSSLRQMLGVDSLEGKTFLDIGSGSGLFSLAARMLGANVHSFDFDPQSVACTREMKRRYKDNDPAWHIEEGSILDPAYIDELGTFDIVYSWGVLHHTGEMWHAIENAMRCVKPDGLLFIALYNDEGLISKYWWTVKRLHNRFTWMQWPLRILYAPYFVGFGWLVNQFRYLSGKRARRGMTLWYDMVDWLGGYPFEVVSPKKMNEYAGDHGFKLVNKYYIGFGLGCNEFVYRRSK